MNMRTARALAPALLALSAAACGPRPDPSKPAESPDLETPASPAGPEAPEAPSLAPPAAPTTPGSPETPKR
jgi:hypothetical protein